MITLDDAVDGPIYSAVQLARLARIIDVASFSAEQIQNLESAALAFVFFHEMEREPGPDDNWQRFWPKRSEIAKALDAVASAALLGNEPDLNQLEVLALPETDRMRLVSAPSPEGFASVTADIAARLRKGGRDKSLNKFWFVQELGQIFLQATGKFPTSRRRRTGEFYGPFFEFTYAALHHIDPHVTTGLDAVVPEVIRSMKIKFG